MNHPNVLFIRSKSSSALLYMIKSFQTWISTTHLQQHRCILRSECDQRNGRLLEPTLLWAEFDLAIHASEQNRICGPQRPKKTRHCDNFKHYGIRIGPNLLVGSWHSFQAFRDSGRPRLLPTIETKSHYLSLRSIIGWIAWTLISDILWLRTTTHRIHHPRFVLLAFQMGIWWWDDISHNRCFSQDIPWTL